MTGGSQEGAGPGAALQLVPARLGLGGAPLPDVAAHVEYAIRADAALVAITCGGAANAVLADVALGRRGLITPG
jgi:hypothetical protein